MLNRNYRKLDMNELDKVAGGIRVLGENGDFNNPENNDSTDPKEKNLGGIPRGGRLGVRV